MTDDSSSYFFTLEPDIEYSTDVEFTIEQWNRLRNSNSIEEESEQEEILEASWQLSPFNRGLRWGTIFTLTLVASAIAGASLTRIEIVRHTILNLNKETNIPNSSPHSQTNQSHAANNLTQPVNLLIVGINPINTFERKLKKTLVGDSATILLLRFQPQNNSVNITSIPKNSQVEIPGLGLSTLREASNHGGINTVSQLVSNMFDDLRIDRYITATPESLLELIDLLGGIEVLMSKTLDNEPTQQKNRAAVWQTLNSKQVSKFFFNSEEKPEKINKLQKQQILIEAILRRLQNPIFAANLTKTAQTFQPYLDTDLTLTEMKALISFLHQREQDEIKFNLDNAHNQ